MSGGDVRSRLTRAFREVRVTVGGEELVMREPTTRQAAELADRLQAIQEGSVSSRVETACELIALCLHTPTGERVFAEASEVMDLPGSVIHALSPVAASLAGMDAAEVAEGKNA